jgi:hypothetical protein
MEFVLKLVVSTLLMGGAFFCASRAWKVADSPDTDEDRLLAIFLTRALCCVVCVVVIFPLWLLT